MSVITAAFDAWTADASSLSAGDVVVTGLRAEPRDDDRDPYLLIVVEAMAPTGRDAWPITDIRSIRQRLREHARLQGVAERLLISFSTAPDTGEASAFPEVLAPPSRDT